MTLLSTSFIAAFNAYGLLIALGIVAGMAGAYFAAKYRGFDPDMVFDACIWAVPLAIVGARLFSVIFESDGPTGFLGIIGFEDGKFVGLKGLSIYGGMIGAIAGLFISSLFWKRKKKKETFLNVMDLGAVFIILGQAVGRWGNFANQELYGMEITNPALQFFPFAVEIDGKGFFQALFFYESILNLVGFAFLLWFLIGKRRSAPGFVVSCYFMWYGLVRFFLEFLRPNEFVLFLGPEDGGIRVSQLMSVLIFLIGAVFLIVMCYKARSEGKRIPIMLTRKEWKKTGRPMYEWGRHPKAPYKKKKVELPAPDEGEDKYWLVPEGETSKEDAASPESGATAPEKAEDKKIPDKDKTTDKEKKPDKEKDTGQAE